MIVINIYTMWCKVNKFISFSYQNLWKTCVKPFYFSVDIPILPAVGVAVLITAELSMRLYSGFPPRYPQVASVIQVCFSILLIIQPCPGTNNGPVVILITDIMMAPCGIKISPIKQIVLIFLPITARKSYLCINICSNHADRIYFDPRVCHGSWLG